MIVTHIEEISKSKVKVTFDQDLILTIYKGELKTFHIKENETIEQEELDQLVQVLKKRAKLRCMNLLKSRDYTVYQLKSKLRDNGYPDEIADCAIEYVASYGYVDDARYAHAYIESASKTKSHRQIENDLVRKGVDKQIILSAFAQLMQEQDEDTEEELIRQYLVKKHYDRSSASYEERRKMIAFLYRKGFLLDKIYKIVGENE